MINFIKKLLAGTKSTPEETTEKDRLKNFDILRYDGLRARQIGKWVYAEKCFKEAIHLKPDMEVMDLLTGVYVQLNKLDDARELLQRMAGQDPARMATYLTTAHVCYLQERYDDMLQAAQTATQLDAGNVLSYYLQAQAYHKLGDALNTIVALTQALSKKEDYTEAYLMRARVLMEMNQLPEAQADIDTLLQYDAENEEAYLLAGNLQRLGGHTQQAAECYAKVIAMNPFNEKAYLQQALLHLDAGEWDQAIGQLDEAIDIKPTAQLYHLRGKAKLGKGDKEGSLADSKLAMELDPAGEKAINGAFQSFDPMYRSNNPLG